MERGSKSIPANAAARAGALRRYTPDLSGCTLQGTQNNICGVVPAAFWGYPLYSMLKTPQEYRTFYLTYLNCFLDCLERSDAAEFSAKLEELMKHEIQYAIAQLSEVGIDAAAALVLDQ